MNDSRSLQDPNGEKWAIDTLEELENNKSLTEVYLKKVVTDVIAEYSSGSIDLTMLIGIIASIKCYDLDLTPDFKKIVEKLSVINPKSDKNMVYNILIEVLQDTTKE